MSWLRDLKAIIDRLPDELPPYTPRGVAISGEPFVWRKVQRQRGQLYFYWLAAPKGRPQHYFPYTPAGFEQAIAYRDSQ